MKKMFNEGNQIHNFMFSSGSGTVINYGSGSGSDFFTSYGSGSGSTSQKVTVPTVPVPQHCSGSRIRTFPSRIRGLKDPGSPSAIKELAFLPGKLFLSFRKYNPGCSSRNRIFSSHSVSGSRIQESKKPRIRIRNTDKIYRITFQKFL
jgi:hypothetical protein